MTLSLSNLTFYLISIFVLFYPAINPPPSSSHSDPLELKLMGVTPLPNYAMAQYFYQSKSKGLHNKISVTLLASISTLSLAHSSWAQSPSNCSTYFWDTVFILAILSPNNNLLVANYFPYFVFMLKSHLSGASLTILFKIATYHSTEHWHFQSYLPCITFLWDS